MASQFIGLPLDASSSPAGPAGGDLSGTYPNPSVATVGGSSAASIHTSQLATVAATDANTASTIVKRDASGNFSAGTISCAAEIISGAGGISFVDPTYTSPVENVGAAGTGGSLLVNTPSLNASFNSGFSISGSFSSPDSVINLKAFGVASAGGYQSTLNLQTTVASVATTNLSCNPDTSVSVYGGLNIATSISRPTAGVSYRGMLWVTQGAAGVTDKISVCLKSAADSYAWIDIVNGG